MKNTNKRGGQRKGSGRKRHTDKKLPISIYFPTSQIEKLDKKQIRKICCKAIDEAIEKTINNNNECYKGWDCKRYGYRSNKECDGCGWWKPF